MSNTLSFENKEVREAVLVTNLADAADALALAEKAFMQARSLLANVHYTQTNGRDAVDLAEVLLTEARNVIRYAD